MRRLWILSLVLAFALLLAIAACSRTEAPSTPQEQRDIRQEQAKPGEEKAPEPETTQLIEDQAPQGCPSCHKKTDDKDYRLSTEVKGIANHPTVPEDATVKDCMPCHGDQSERPFKKVLHRVHIVEGQHYTDRYDKNCINCHQIGDDGTVTVKGLNTQGT